MEEELGLFGLGLGLGGVDVIFKGKFITHLQVFVKPGPPPR